MYNIAPKDFVQRATVSECHFRENKWIPCLLQLTNMSVGYESGIRFWRLVKKKGFLLVNLTLLLAVLKIE